MRFALRADGHSLRAELENAMKLAIGGEDHTLYGLRWRLSWRPDDKLHLQAIEFDAGDMRPLRVYQRVLEKYGPWPKGEER
jgi:hypothetical protein